MPCYKPLKGWRSNERTEKGKRTIVFRPQLAHTDQPLEIPCGQCIGCRLERSRQWAMRMTHEAAMHDLNCFITLTYNKENLPTDGSLDKTHFQKFIKALRKKFQPVPIRYFHCGEYGDDNRRPHYHAILFGFDFLDKKFHKHDNGYNLYISETLDQIWGKGHCFIGTVTFESTAYVARYHVKKTTGNEIEILNTYLGRQPEYATMSLKPGIGANYIEKYQTDAYPSDFLVMRGVKMQPAKFYDSLLEKVDPDLYKRIKIRRQIEQKERREDNTSQRLWDKEQVKKSQQSNNRRSI